MSVALRTLLNDLNLHLLPRHLLLLSVRCREAAAGRGTGRDRAARAGGGGEVSERQAGTTCMACMHARQIRLRAHPCATASVETRAMSLYRSRPGNLMRLQSEKF